ncbi:MAG TPA: hypothetical protein VI916_15675 [Acidimicrobiia bacterium]|nr:hypothetical protein [Acidimicrobiia bacterium]
MSEPIVYIDRSRIREGCVDDLRAAIADLVEFIDAREPQLLYYGFFVDEKNGAMTVVAVHPDSASLELHMKIGAAAFRTFADFIEMERIEVYGEPSDDVVAQLHTKARDLGRAGSVVIHPRRAGFTRLDTREA